MSIWLWDAGTHTGVCDDEAEAVAAAEEHAVDGGTLTVERAVLVNRSGWRLAYGRLGVGQSGRCEDGKVAWTPLGKPVPA